MPAVSAQRVLRQRASDKVILRLEYLAHAFCGKAVLRDASPEAFVEAQLALTLEHLARQRAMSVQLLRQLVRTECSLDTLVLPTGNSYRSPDPALKSWVRDRLLALEQERRRVIVEHERRVAELEVQLLQLLSQRLVLQEAGSNYR